MNKREFNRFLMEGAVALTEASNYGMRVDVAHLATQLKRNQRRIASDRASVMNSEGGVLWRQIYGEKMNMDSSAQLGRILFQEMGIEPSGTTPNGKPKTDHASLVELEARVPFISDLMVMRKRIKTGQYLSQISRETVDGYIHPSFHLHKVRTYRSSSSGPNFQNLPIRDPEQGRLIRKCFIPRPGRQIVEIDYGGIEVKVAACYHKDPTMLKYIRDTTKDLHRDMAAECYKLPVGEVSKLIRYCGKNKFVFPQFYGSWWRECAASLWDSVAGMKLETVSGMPLAEHLQAVGLGNRMRFEKHIEAVEKHFWGKRFRKYDEWKKKWYKGYLGRGYIDGLTGFRCSNPMSRNDCINYPVQGAAFHCLLWSFIRSTNEFRERGFSRCHVGQVHDSMVLDAVPGEIPDILGCLNRIMTKDILKEWEWIIVPLEVEAEVAPIDESWLSKKTVAIGE